MSALRPFPLSSTWPLDRNGTSDFRGGAGTSRVARADGDRAGVCGIFFKSNGTLVQLRPKTKWVAMSFPLSRRLTHARITRKPMASGRKIYHFFNLTSAGDVDDELRGWLTESFHQFADEGRGQDPSLIL